MSEIICKMTLILQWIKAKAFYPAKAHEGAHALSMQFISLGEAPGPFGPGAYLFLRPDHDKIAQPLNFS